MAHLPLSLINRFNQIQIKININTRATGFNMLKNKKPCFLSKAYYF